MINELEFLNNMHASQSTHTGFCLGAESSVVSGVYKLMVSFSF